MIKILITIILTISPILAQCDWNGDGTLNVIDVVETVDCILNDCFSADIYGCMDPEATNYNQFANVDDGSCVYDIEIEWVIVSAGEYTFGENDENQIIDYDYEIMKYEITHEQFKIYLDAASNAGLLTINDNSVQGYYPGDENYGQGLKEFVDLDDYYSHLDYSNNEFIIHSGYENHPITDVTWFGAWAYAEHFGLRLPTEQEWEKAARGNTGWEYPWGNTMFDNQANFYESGNPNYQLTTPVGYYNGSIYNGYQTIDSPSFFNAYDMAGNVWGWTNSWFDTGRRVTRGGAFYYEASYLRSWYRHGINSTTSDVGIGFRCVRSSDQFND